MSAKLWSVASNNAFSTTLNGNLTAIDTTVPLTSTSGLVAPGVLVIDRVDGNNVNTSIIREYITYTSINGNSVEGVTRGAAGSTAQSHLSGAQVEETLSVTHWGDLLDFLAVSHDSAGKLITSTATITNLLNVAGASIVGLAIREIDDVNSNEILKTDYVADAVNEITLKNAATNTAPQLYPTGNDSNIGLDFKMKGTGVFRKPTLVEIQVLDPTTDTSTGDGKAFFRIPAELNGMNLTGVAATVYTAGTTNTTDIQLRNKTDSQDMLSTKLTIDSGETDTSSAATAAVIDTTHDDIATGDVIAIDIDAISTTAAKGLIVQMKFELP